MNNKLRKIDKTFLSLDKAEERGIIHRDYIAHCHRWTYAFKMAMKVKNRDGYLSVLDIGCGKEVPFLKTLYTNKLCPDNYLGIDAGKINSDQLAGFGTKIGERIADRSIRLLENTDFSLIKDPATYPEFCQFTEMRPINLIVSFEVLEHMTRTMSRLTLLNINKIIKNQNISKKSLAIISTPVFDSNKGMAANHINEMTRAELYFDIKAAGLKVLKNYGTFMDQAAFKNEIQRVHEELSEEMSKTHGLYDLTDEEANKRILLSQKHDLNLSLFHVFNSLHSYYDSNLLSTIFAPLFPQCARNNLWVLTNEKDLTHGDDNDYDDIIKSELSAEMLRLCELSKKDINEQEYGTSATTELITNINKLLQQL